MASCAPKRRESSLATFQCRNVHGQFATRVRHQAGAQVLESECLRRAKGGRSAATPSTQWTSRERERFNEKERERSHRLCCVRMGGPADHNCEHVIRSDAVVPITSRPHCNGPTLVLHVWRKATRPQERSGSKGLATDRLVDFPAHEVQGSIHSRLRRARPV